ncbi:MAG: T9SS type A sorting domain-containing protein [Bacteroidetes bacterium]|nr:T9SS type A sorting domain-containing protein [Bacteroidota bacterium]
MKKILLLCSLLCAFVMHGQRFEWALSAGSTGTETATDLATDPVTGTNYIIGTYTGTLTLGTTTLVSVGGIDIFFAKLDRNGSYLWAQGLGSTADDEGNGITFDASGNVYVTGGFRATMTFTTSPTTTLTPMGPEDAFLAKYNSNGAFQWVTDINDNLNAGDESGKAVEVSNATSNVFVAIDEPGQHYIYVKRFDMAAGTYNSVYQLSATTVSIKDLKVRRNTSTSPVTDETYICGTYSGGLQFNFGTTYHNSISSGTDMFVTKITNWQGSPVRSWSFSGGGTGSTDVCNAIDINPSTNGGFCIAGTAAPSATINGTALGNTSGDAFVGYYTEVLSGSGITKVYTKPSKASNSYGMGVVMDANNYVYLTGYGVVGGFKNGTVTGMPASGIMVTKFLPTGYVASRVSAGGSSSVSNGTRITLDNQGNAYVFGTYQSSNNFSVTTLTSAGATDVHLDKLNYTSIASPTVPTTKCVSTKDGDYVTVNFKVSKKLNSANTFTLQVDTTGSGDFVSYINLATVTIDTSSSISTYLPRGKYSYADVRVTSSNTAYVGDQSYFSILPKLVAAVTPTAMTRCSNDPGSVSTFTASGSDVFGTDYVFSPSSGISNISDPVFSATPGSSTVYTMTAYNTNGCTDTVAFRVTVNAAPSMTINSMNACPGTTLALTNTVTPGVTGYTWSPGSTLSSTSAAVPVASPTANTLYSYTITNAQNCKYSSNVNVSLYSAPVPNAGPPSYTTCLGSTVPLNGTGGGAVSYTWTPSTGVAAPNSLTTTVTTSVTTTYTLYGTNSLGCIGKDPITINIGNVSVDAGNNATITCGSNATLNATPTGTFVGPYTYNWTPTVALTSYTNQSTVANPQTPRWYYVTMTTANGCSATDSVKVISNEPNYSTSFSVTPSQIITLPSPAQFNNNTPSMSNYTFYWYFGDGTMVQSNNPTVFHNYSYNGTYDVTLVAVSNANGCADTLRIPGYVYVSGGSSCSTTASVTAPNGVNGCVGDSVKLMANTGTGLTYQWMLNGVNISGATSSTYYAQSGGNYAVTVSSSSCAAISSSKLVSFNGAPTTPSITASGNLNLCGGGTLYLQANSGYSSYHWSTGATSQNISINMSGVYTVTVTNTAGCKAAGSYSANTSAMPAPDICIVGVDSLTNYCKVVWNKTVTTAIDSFIIYREGVVANQFNRLAAQSYTAFSTYIDNTSNPQIQSYRYKLSLKDTCGIESLLSSDHKTIHLTINAGMGGAWNLIWSSYGGVSYSTYNIYRGTALNNISLLTSVSASNNSYTDLTPPGGMVYYQIEIVNPGSCNPTAKVATNYSSSRSNIVLSIPTGIAGYNELLNNIQVMPNPFNEELTVNIGKINSKNVTITISDVLGKTILSKQDNNPTQTFNLAYLEAGVYYITIMDESGNRFTKKLIKN